MNWIYLSSSAEMSFSGADSCISGAPQCFHSSGWAQGSNGERGGGEQAPSNEKEGKRFTRPLPQRSLARPSTSTSTSRPRPHPQTRFLSSHLLPSTNRTSPTTRPSSASSATFSYRRSLKPSAAAPTRPGRKNRRRRRRTRAATTLRLLLGQTRASARSAWGTRARSRR